MKGVFAKNERGYRLNAIKKCFWSLPKLKFELKFHNILYFSWSESFFWKHLFLFRGFLTMKTTFSVWVVFNNFLLVDATDRRLEAIKSALSLYPLSFFANTPFNTRDISTCSAQANLVANLCLSCWKAAYLSTNIVTEQFLKGGTG